MSRIGCYIRARLHRRLFLWFVAAILATGATVFVVLSVLGGTDVRRHYEGTRGFIIDRFVEVWDAPGERSALARELSSRLNLNVTLRDSGGAVLESYGPRCFRQVAQGEVIRDGQMLGSVEVCSCGGLRRHLNLVLALGAAGVVLSALSASLSRKATRSLVDLARGASEIGQGRYDTEVRLTHDAPGELKLLGEALMDMGAKIKKQMADQRELLASVSHEIRSPLARIRLLLELAKPEEVADSGGAGQRPTQPAATFADETVARMSQDKALADMEREIDEIDELVGALLASSRVDFSALSLRLTDVVEAVERALTRASISAKLEVVGEVRRVPVDATLFARALGNLCENALAHAHGVESVRIVFGDRMVRFEVLDRGSGFLPGEETKVFQSFYRRPNGKHDSLGLGLSLVKRIAEAHGGSAFAGNREGGGAAVGFEVRVGDPDSSVAE